MAEGRRRSEREEGAEEKAAEALRVNDPADREDDEMQHRQAADGSQRDGAAGAPPARTPGMG